MGGCCSRDEVGRMPTSGAMERVDAFYAAEEDSVRVGDGGARVRLKGSCMVASMFTQQGWKGVNQDAMTLWEGFAGDQGTIFCGVFDGHGPYGHRVACHVRDALPSRLQSGMKAFEGGAGDTGGDGDGWFASWNATIVSAFEELDKELSNHPWIDCICSGATAVTILKERDHLIIANLGDSRAVLCTRDDDDQLVPVQLTVDQKPNLPSEAERIRSCRGRVFSLEEEPDVHRLWLPDEDSPGLAMARAFGDLCLKDFGLIATPQISHRKLSDKDEFVVLATDGVWDVLSNEEVIKIVSSANKRSAAAKQVVDRAVRAWWTARFERGGRSTPRPRSTTAPSSASSSSSLFLRPTSQPAEFGETARFRRTSPARIALGRREARSRNRRWRWAQADRNRSGRRWMG
ncbi:unnamed protein product [Musa banksii]